MKHTGIYIHIPFCVSKCVYCDFLSAPPANNNQIKRYISSLADAIRKKGEGLEPEQRLVDSVFFGGGTPSSIPAGELIFVLETLRENFTFTQDAEISVECNPGTVDEFYLRELKKNGVNRISFGLQSAINSELKTLGRIHSFEDFKESLRAARSSGFENVNVDIISAIPGQTTDSFMETLDRVAGLSPEHISCYSLILEEGTRLFEYPEEFPPPPSEDEERQMYYAACSFLADKGYAQYEISNFYRKDENRDFRCRHNLGYWERAPYIGFGAGAAGFDGKFRYKNISDVEEYIKSPVKEDISEREEVNRDEAMAEFMFLGLRKSEGISGGIFKENFGVSLEEIYGDILNRQMEDGFIQKTKEGYRLTGRGVEVSNAVLAEFLPD